MKSRKLIALGGVALLITLMCMTAWTLFLSPPQSSTAAPFAGSNKGISDDGDTKVANYDRYGNSYSAQALARAGIDRSGMTFPFGDKTLVWLYHQPEHVDNVQARGQTLNIAASKEDTTLTIVGSATNGPSSGEATLGYADGSTQKVTLGFSDWTLNAGKASMRHDNQIVARMPYRNVQKTGREMVKTYLFATDIPLQAGKTLQHVTLPTQINQGRLHVFALGTAHASGVTVPGKPTATASPTVAATTTAVVTTTPTATPTPEPAANCNQSLQQLVDQAAANATIHIPACLYREEVTINKTVTLLADAGAEIRGSDLWTDDDWTANGATIVSKKTVPFFGTHGQCAPNTNDRCLRAEQVFVDGHALTPVASNPGADQFALDSDRHVTLSADHKGHQIEVTTRQHWITGNADNVTIQGFRMQYAANDAQSGALQGDGKHWTVQNNVLSDAHGAVVNLGPQIQLLNNDIFRGGQLGIHGGGDGGLVQGNKIHDNNIDGFDSGWEAGGSKTVTHDLVFDGNEVYSNNGPGLWCDIHCTNMTYQKNRIHHNMGMGILFEISDGAKIFDNVVWENAQSGFTAWGWGGGIVVSTSRNVEVYNNIVAWNPDGIAVLSANRSDSPGPVVGDYVHDNTIIMSGQDPNDHSNQVYALVMAQDYAGALYDPASNNHGQHNAFWFPAAEKQGQNRFSFGHEYDKLSDFASSPSGKDSYYLMDEQKNQILQQVQISLTPQVRVAVAQ